ncbi:MAG: hypothetical protein EBZ77_10295 [Chitinophagia bacterium]|nr:hypothetical protein [Chitinophagia bacterium]
MKKILLAVTLLLAMGTFQACNFTDYEAKKQVVQDSLATIFPTWQAAKIWIADDNTTINVVIGDQSFYKAAPEVKQEKANAAGKMILRIFGKGNYLKTGKLSVTNDIRNTSMTPADAINLDMNIAAAKAAGK